MRTVVIGSTGQLGTDIMALGDRWPGELLGVGSAQYDLRDAAAVYRLFDAVQPEVVINTAAYHNLKACQERPDEAYALNAAAPMLLAELCDDTGAALVHFSTDYVFGGDATRPYVEDDATAPLQVYGLTKVYGEQSTLMLCPTAYVVRTASLFGHAGSRGKGGNFIETMLAKSAAGERLEVVDDVVMSPTSTVWLAVAVQHLITQRPPYGVYHAVCEGACSWYELALEACVQAGVPHDLHPVTLDSRHESFLRPRHSALDAGRLLQYTGCPAISWHEALGAYLTNRTPIT